MPGRRPERIPEVVRIPVAVIDLTAEIFFKVLKYTSTGRKTALIRKYFTTKTRHILPAETVERKKPWPK